MDYQVCSISALRMKVGNLYKKKLSFLLQKGKMPEIQKKANTALILKDGHDLILTKSYRPISIINCGCEYVIVNIVNCETDNDLRY